MKGKGKGRLVLSRRIAESIKIGDDIEIFVADINKAEGKVDLAISAPKDIKILKKETYLKDLSNNGLSTRNKSR